MSDRPERNKAGEVSVNIPESAVDSVDQIFDAAGLPEPGSIGYRLTPDHVLDAAGVPTPDELSDELIRDLDERLDIDHPTER